MSVFDYIFDHDWAQRSDIESLKRENASLAYGLGHVHSSEISKAERVTELEKQIGELALLSKTLMQVLPKFNI